MKSFSGHFTTTRGARAFLAAPDSQSAGGTETNAENKDYSSGIPPENIPDGVSRGSSGQIIFAPTESQSTKATAFSVAKFADAAKGGSLSVNSIINNRNLFGHMNDKEYTAGLEKLGYEVTSSASRHSANKSTVLRISKQPGNISQVQISPESHRHGSPYVKISTTSHGKFKIINGSPSDYKSDGEETAHLIFLKPEKKH